MKVLSGIILVLIVALIAASPPVQANLANSEDQNGTSNATASVAIMNDALSQNADKMVQANTVQSIESTTANMTTIISQEVALVAGEIVAADSRYNISGEIMISANTAETTSMKEARAFAPDLVAGFAYVNII
jgi:hypothetical protein